MGIRLPQINIVGTLMLAVAAALVYSAVKFGGVYLEAAEIDSILDSHKYEAAEIPDEGNQQRELAIVETASQEIIRLGIDEAYLEVYLGDGFGSLHADYRREVRFPFGQSVHLDMERSIEIPR